MRNDSALVWENNLDGKYRCYVLSQVDTYGYLRVERIEDGLRILDTEVPISRHFRNQDVMNWGDRCMLAVYKFEKANLSSQKEP